MVGFKCGQSTTKSHRRGTREKKGLAGVCDAIAETTIYEGGGKNFHEVVWVSLQDFSKNQA
jgi:hypothetical protein